jgi:periplasmic protein TonB
MPARALDSRGLKMGKIVKYCSSCDEGFAERFGFCPDCGAPLQTFEMNPVENEVSLKNETVESASVEPTPVEAEIDATPVEVEPEVPAPVFLQAEEETLEEIAAEEEPFEEVAAPAVAAAPANYQTAPMYADERRSVEESTNWDYTHADDGGFYVTVIQEKNAKQRNVLLLGASAFVLVAVLTSWGISLFQKELGVGAIGGETSLAYLIDEVPMPVEDEPQDKDKDKGGGGGGGGREDKEETSQGDLADQSRTPTHIKPDVRIYKNDNFELKQPIATTEGDRKFPKEYDRYGDPNSKFAGLSNGPGMGGGQGSGYGQGQGSGYGTGAGSGSGSGSGGGNGDGNGDGDGSGGRGAPPGIKPPVTTPYRITFQPRATYTDEARANNVTGAVRLKITLLASGQVGSIVPVTRLPYGLTERAIAAAKQIRFEPKMVNGQAVAVTVTREYTFTIY